MPTRGRLHFEVITGQGRGCSLACERCVADNSRQEAHVAVGWPDDGTRVIAVCGPCKAFLDGSLAVDPLETLWKAAWHKVRGSVKDLSRWHGSTHEADAVRALRTDVEALEFRFAVNRKAREGLPVASEDVAPLLPPEHS